MFRRTIRTQVYLGAVDTTDGTGVIYLLVERNNTFIHPSYNGKNYQNDISILILPMVVPLTGELSDSFDLIKYELELEWGKFLVYAPPS